MYYLDYYYPITRVRDNISVFSEPLGEEINGKGYECPGSVLTHTHRPGPNHSYQGPNTGLVLYVWAK